MDHDENVYPFRFNWIIVIIAITVGVLSWLGIRQQVSVGDEQFVKGMIPHLCSSFADV
jgi:hypothetical protein